MALRTIVQEGDEVLTKKCRPVTVFDGRLAQLLDDMGETMKDAHGLGLAGPQVGVLRRLFVALDESALPEEPTPEEVEAFIPMVREFVNPEIIETEGEETSYEGCLSFPGEYGAIKRPTRVVVKAQDRSGKEFTFEADGLLARCLCHEANHLDGITIADLAEYFYDPDTPHPLDHEMDSAPQEEDA